MNIVFFGSSEFAVVPLKALIEAGYKISCVVTQPDKKKGRGLHLEGTPVKIIAKASGLKVFQLQKINSKEGADFLRALKPDLFIVIAYGQILSQEILDIPKIFSINAHASLLPKYRGAAPINWAIIKGEKTTGVTIIKMNAKMDAGEIIMQRKFGIDENDTSVILSKRLSESSALLLLESLSAIENKKVKLAKQDESAISLAPLLKKEDGLIDWSRSASDLHDLARGMLPWPGAFTYYKGKILKIHKAKVGVRCPVSGVRTGEVIEIFNNMIKVAAGDGCLDVLELQIEGKRPMSAQEFISGHKIKVKECLGKI
ncbi:MAG: methionyl-tRNA formyltransferase [Candidatus Omnitrophica bacterium]|nr:methionyl-tRNA formyltransferase [Candidatus Omnitrophota bacterium]